MAGPKSSGSYIGLALAGAMLAVPHAASAQTDQADIEALPVAPPGVALDDSQTLVRLAFGSCIGEEDSQAFWGPIAALHPQLFIAMGDNVYGDAKWDGGADLASFRNSYATLAAHDEFARFRQAVPMLAVWDDHDFGPNDGGGDLIYKQSTETLFETFWDSSPRVRAHPGTYDSVMIGPDGRQVQLIMLDTRFFRSALTRLPEGDPRPGRYMASADPAAQMLGEAQWAWLQAELARPADLRILVSSIQVLSQAHGWEKWGNMPQERARLLDMLANRAGGETVILSGDRHRAAFYRDTLPGSGETIWEFTSSSLNKPSGPASSPADEEPDALRAFPMVREANSGLIDIDWEARKLTMRLLNAEGQQLHAQPISF